jgi:hypothetical protein
LEKPYRLDEFFFGFFFATITLFFLLSFPLLSPFLKFYFDFFFFADSCCLYFFFRFNEDGEVFIFFICDFFDDGFTATNDFVPWQRT